MQLHLFLCESLADQAEVPLNQVYFEEIQSKAKVQNMI
jgi:hypothetical protein